MKTVTVEHRISFGNGTPYVSIEYKYVGDWAPQNRGNLILSATGATEAEAEASINSVRRRMADALLDEDNA